MILKIPNDEVEDLLKLTLRDLRGRNIEVLCATAEKCEVTDTWEIKITYKWSDKSIIYPDGSAC